MFKESFPLKDVVVADQENSSAVVSLQLQLHRQEFQTSF